MMKCVQPKFLRTIESKTASRGPAYHIRDLNIERATISVGVVVLNQRLIAFDDGIVGVVAGLLLADFHLDVQPVDVFQCRFLEVLVGPVGDVSGLEADD